MIKISSIIKLYNISSLIYLVAVLSLLNYLYIVKESYMGFYSIFILSIYILILLELWIDKKIVHVLSVTGFFYILLYYLPYYDYTHYPFNYRWGYSDITKLYVPTNLALQSHIVFLISYKIIKNFSKKTLPMPKNFNLSLFSKNINLLFVFILFIFVLFFTKTYGHHDISGAGAYLYLILLVGGFIPYGLFLVDRVFTGFVVQVLITLALFKAEANGAAILTLVWFFVLLYLYKKEYKKYFYAIVLVAISLVWIVLQNKYTFNDGANFYKVLMDAFVINMGRLEQLHSIHDVYHNGLLDYTWHYFITAPFTYLFTFFLHFKVNYADEVTKVIYNTKDMWGSIGGCSTGSAYSDLGYFGIYIYFIFYGVIAGFIEKIKLNSKLNLVFYIFGLLFVYHSINEGFRLDDIYFLIIPIFLLSKITLFKQRNKEICKLN